MVGADRRTLLIPVNDEVWCWDGPRSWSSDTVSVLVAHLLPPALLTEKERKRLRLVFREYDRSIDGSEKEMFVLKAHGTSAKESEQSS